MSSGALSFLELTPSPGDPAKWDAIAAEAQAHFAACHHKPTCAGCLRDESCNARPGATPKTQDSSNG